MLAIRSGPPTSWPSDDRGLGGYGPRGLAPRAQATCSTSRRNGWLTPGGRLAGQGRPARPTVYSITPTGRDALRAGWAPARPILEFELMLKISLPTRAARRRACRPRSDRSMGADRHAENMAIASLRGRHRPSGARARAGRGGRFLTDSLTWSAPGRLGTTVIEDWPESLGEAERHGMSGGHRRIRAPRRAGPAAVAPPPAPLSSGS